MFNCSDKLFKWNIINKWIEHSQSSLFEAYCLCIIMSEWIVIFVTIKMSIVVRLRKSSYIRGLELKIFLFDIRGQN